MAKPIYNHHPAWATALATAAAALGKPNGSALQVVAHLGYRGPQHVVVWHQGTTGAVPTKAAALGITPGMAVPAAMQLALAACPQHKAIAALVAATATING